MVISRFGHTTPTRVLNFRNRSVVWSNERHATPSYKTFVRTGDRTQVEDTASQVVTTFKGGSVTTRAGPYRRLPYQRLGLAATFRNFTRRTRDRISELYTAAVRNFTQQSGISELVQIRSHEKLVANLEKLRTMNAFTHTNRLKLSMI